MNLCWADFRLDPDARTLTHRGAPVRVQALAFDLLALLLRNRGRGGSDDVVRRELWPGVVVSAASLRQALKEARRAIGDDGRKQEAIETVRGRGLRFVAAVSTEGGVDTLFVGRDDLLSILARELDETDSGHGGVTLLVGRSGIGKTTTLIEVAARADARGWRVLEGLARAGAEADTYALWTRAAEALGATALTEASRELPASDGISESNRFARYRALETALLSGARTRPVLLCFDDLHFADRESLALLRFLAPALRAARVRIIGGHRPVAAGEAQTRDLAALAALTATRVLELRGLAAGEIRTLVKARLGAALSARAAEALAAQTEGNPLLALEVVRALHASGATLEHSLPEEIAARVALGLMPLLRRRLAALSAAARRALHAAAAIGGGFDAELVYAVTGETREEVERALLEAEQGAVIEREREHAWRFAHPLLAEAVAEDLAARGGDAGARLHLRLLETLEAAGERDAFRLATHALGAGSLLSPAAVVERLRRAAQAAWQVHAVADAEAWQQRAVAVAERAALPPLALCDLLLEVGELGIPNGGAIAARVPFDRAARIARTHGDATRLARAALGYAHRAFTLDALDTTLEWLRAAHAAPCGDAALDTRVVARLGAELMLSAPADPSAAEALMREGVSRARSLGDPLTLARVLADQSIALFSPADPPAALALAQEVASCGRHAGEVEIEFRGLAEIATVQLERGDRSGVDEAFAECEAFVRRAPIPYAQGVTRGIAAMCALLDGRFDEASDAMADADRHARATGSLGFGVVAGLQRFLLARERGGLQELLPALDQARAHLPSLVGLGAVAGLAHGLCGNAGHAREAANELLARTEGLARDRTLLATLAVGAELAYLAQCAPLAHAVEPMLAPFAALHAVAGSAASYWGAVAHALGFVAAAQGRHQEAIGHFGRAQRAHEAMRSPPWSRRSAEAAAEIRRAARRRLVS